jgi:hypothetical protein
MSNPTSSARSSKGSYGRRPRPHRCDRASRVKEIACAQGCATRRRRTTAHPPALAAHTLASQAINRGMTLETHPRHDPTPRQDRQPGRRRRILCRHRKGRSPLPTRQSATRRHERTEDGSATARAPRPARQRLLHPTPRIRLRLRSHLRNLHVLPDQHSHSGPPCNANAATPPTTTRGTVKTTV